MANVEVRMGARVTTVTQDAESATVDVNEESLVADYVIGADGGRSTVRKSLGIEFEGYLARAISCHHHEIRFPGRAWLLPAQLHGRSGGVDEPLQGRGRRSQGALARGVQHARGRVGRRSAFRCRGARVYRVFTYPSASAITCISTCTPCISAWRRASARAACTCVATPPVNNPIGGLDSIAASTSLALGESPEERRRPDSYERIRRPLNIKYVQEQTIANKKRGGARSGAARQTLRRAARHGG